MTDTEDAGRENARPPAARGDARGAAVERPLRPLRRRDRAVEDQAWIRGMLGSAPVGVLAIGGRDRGAPHQNANLFVFDAGRGAVYLHTARAGATRDEVGRRTPASFTVYEMGRLLPADEALEFSVEFRSVVAVGNISVVEEPGEAGAALQALLDKYAPHLDAGTDYRPITAGELKRTAVYRLDIETWSGKRKKAGPDAPGAYSWPPPG